ncbi:DNA circularization N-terminal domain-containing protein [Limnohabitans sp.]|uniref:DNA circularization protein n=1 Tax=Limnohabitans sp. TaxID=1907725 RepID=UPI00286F8E59|nr:DNA circularization N-terminal domain-containing protein [Limnohabitans sp.]
MSWIDELQQASFRGVPFHVETTERKPGFHTVLRDYPFQDLPTVFRMGRAAEEIKFSAYVIGEDYTQWRDALEEALDAPGVGELVHPTSGTILVYVLGQYPIKEAPTTEGGVARFELTFVRADERRYPTTVGNSAVDAARAAWAGTQATADELAHAFDVANAPGWAADRLMARVRDSVAAVWGVMGAATAGMGDFTNTITRNYQVLRDGMNDLIRQPRLLADAVATLYELPRDLDAAKARDLRAAYQSLFDMGSRVAKTDFETSSMPAVGAGPVMFGQGVSTLASDTAARQQLAALSTASDQLFEGLATCSWAQASAASELSSYDEAMALRSAATDQITRLLQRASATAPMAMSAGTSMPAQSWHDAMLAVLTSTLADLQRRSSGLARMMSYTPQAWTPVWVVSYQLYGTTDWADEIMALNPHIEHPMLVPPGRALRVARHD